MSPHVRPAGGGLGTNSCRREPPSPHHRGSPTAERLPSPRGAVSITNSEGRLQWTMTFPLRHHVGFVYHRSRGGNCCGSVECLGEVRRRANPDRSAPPVQETFLAMACLKRWDCTSVAWHGQTTTPSIMPLMLRRLGPP